MEQIPVCILELDRDKRYNVDVDLEELVSALPLAGLLTVVLFYHPADRCCCEAGQAECVARTSLPLSKQVCNLLCEQLRSSAETPIAPREMRLPKHVSGQEAPILSSTPRGNISPALASFFYYPRGPRMRSPFYLLNESLLR